MNSIEFKPGKVGDIPYSQELSPPFQVGILLRGMHRGAFYGWERAQILKRTAPPGRGNQTELLWGTVSQGFTARIQ